MRFSFQGSSGSFDANYDTGKEADSDVALYRLEGGGAGAGADSAMARQVASSAAQLSSDGVYVARAQGSTLRLPHWCLCPCRASALLAECAGFACALLDDARDEGRCECPRCLDLGGTSGQFDWAAL